MSFAKKLKAALPQARLHRVLDKFGYDEDSGDKSIKRYVGQEQHYGEIHTHPKGHWVHLGWNGDGRYTPNTVWEVGHGHASLHRYLKGLPWHECEDCGQTKYREHPAHYDSPPGT
jgi:hypothetical protein